MELTPLYGNSPVITLDGDPADIVEPAIRQRRRLAAALSSFDEAQWKHPSRCEGWSSRDVIVHLDSTNAFWTFSLAQGIKGEPTQLLASFDPVASPAELVAGSQNVSSAEVLERFVASTTAFTDLIASISGNDWAMLAEAPPGHLNLSAVIHHALWDSWIHERDILLPLGIQADEEPDEIVASLRYVAALGAGFGITQGDIRRGVLALNVTDSDVDIVIDIGNQVAVRAATADADLLLEGRAVDLLEALSIRAPMDQPIPAQHAWMLSGFLETFDVAAS